MTEAILRIMSAAIRGALALFPESVLPSFMSSGSVQSAADSLIGYLAPLSGWVPFGPLGVVMTPIVACITFAVGVRIVRMVVSLFTGGGGSAA